MSELENKLSQFVFDGSIAHKIDAPLLKQHRPDQQSYYRSRLIHVDLACNNLIASASSLLAVHRRLLEKYNLEYPGEVYHLLIHEIFSFETQARQNRYTSDQIALARFLLLAALEEALSLHPQMQNNWLPEQLLKTFQAGQFISGKQYFIILEKLSRDPDINLELLELAYVILQQGYQGSYYGSTEGALRLAELNEDLYQIIQAKRAHIMSLFSETSLPPPIEPFLLKPNLSYRPIGLFLLVGLFSIMIFYLGMIHYALQPFERHLAAIQSILR